MFQKVCEAFTRLLFLWVILVCMLGYAYPPALTFLRPYVEWLFACTMLGIGAVLKPSDFLPVIRKPYWVLLGSLAQFVIMPTLGFMLAKLLRLPPELALGLIIVGATPGAMASNVIAYLARADVAYSVALTSTSTLLAPILTPSITYLLGSAWMPVQFWPMFLSIVKMVILPLLAGFGIRYLLRERINRIAPAFPAVSAVFIAFICGLVVALNVNHLQQLTVLVLLAVMLHNGLGLLLGYAAGIGYRFDIKRRRTLALEVGMQNSGLGVVLALKHFSPQTALPGAVFAVWCIITASILAEYWSQRPPAPPDTDAAC